MPYGAAADPPDGPKSGCRNVLAEFIEPPAHAALCASTGKPLIGVFHTLLAGNIGHDFAPGTVVPTDAVVAAVVTLQDPKAIITAAQPIKRSAVLFANCIDRTIRVGRRSTGELGRTATT